MTNGDPTQTIFLVTAVTGLAGFVGWLLRDYIAWLKAEITVARGERDDWKKLAMTTTTVAEKAVAQE